MKLHVFAIHKGKQWIAAKDEFGVRVKIYTMPNMVFSLEEEHDGVPWVSTSYVRLRDVITGWEVRNARGNP